MGCNVTLLDCARVRVTPHQLSPEELAQALVSYAEAKGVLGAQQIRDEFDNLFARMIAGEGLATVNSSVNGRTFGFQLTMSVESAFRAFGMAIKEIDGTTATTTRACFPCIDR